MTEKLIAPAVSCGSVYPENIISDVILMISQSVVWFQTIKEDFCSFFLEKMSDFDLTPTFVLKITYLIELAMVESIRWY